jgi:hypothetical protein
MQAVDFQQDSPLGDLLVQWIAPDDFNPEQRLQGSDFDTPVTANRITKTSNKSDNNTDQKGENSERTTTDK